MTFKAKDILEATGKLHAITESLTDLFYDEGVFTRLEVDSYLFKIIESVNKVEDYLLLMQARGYARMELK